MLLIKYPTRQRPEIFRQTLELYYEYLSNVELAKFVISMDTDDESMNNKTMQEYLKGKPNLWYYYGNNTNKVQAINANISEQAFDTLLLAADDMLPQVRGYDKIICDAMREHFPKLDGCLHFNDGRKARRLNTLPIMGRALYDKWGYIYHPSYQSLYCDDEFQAVTERDNKSVYIDQVIIKHVWMEITGGKRDALYNRNEMPWKEDKALFQKRQAAGFP